MHNTGSRSNLWLLVQDKISNNANGEHILIYMLTDDDKVIRELADNRILNIRRNAFLQYLSGRADNSVREFTEPMINFTGNHI